MSFEKGCEEIIWKWKTCLLWFKSNIDKLKWRVHPNVTATQQNRTEIGQHVFSIYMYPRKLCENLAKTRKKGFLVLNYANNFCGPSELTFKSGSKFDMILCTENKNA